MKKHGGHLLLIFVFLLVFASNLPAKNRGIQVLVETPAGRTIKLYDDSYALVIGNGNYRNSWNPLPGAIKDVKEVSDALTRKGFKVTIKTDLTKEEFSQAFMEFVYTHGKDKNNRLLFYYAGHGYTRKMATDEQLGYLVMVNAPGPEDFGRFSLHSVDMISMVTHAKMIKAKHALFIFDSCFSGTVLNLRDRITPEVISDKVSLPVRQFITAGRANESVPDYSVFKQSFLDILEGRDEEPIRDGYLTGEELGLYLQNKVPTYNKNQHPQYGKIRDPKLDKGDFVFQLASSGAVIEKPAPKQSQAYLSVESNVSGAGVFVDGQGVGATPLADVSISEGEHRILVKKPGYETYQKRVLFEKGRSISLYVDLSMAAPKKGRLYVETNPSNATVKILNSGISFYQGIELTPGEYGVLVSAAGYEKYTIDVTINASEDKEIKVNLERSLSQWPIKIIFGGGPAGGTFIVVANGIQVFKPVKASSNLSVKAQTSAGSVDNLRKTNAGRQQMSVVYSSHVWLGRNGQMINDPKKYENVLAVAWLYGAPAQMVVRTGSGIKSVKDLAGKKVGVGNAGSGAFRICELFFSHMGVWNKIERNAMGYNDAAAAFGNYQLDAFWLFTAFPSSAVIMAAQTNKIALLDLDADAKSSGFYDKYPFFGKLSVPAGTYKGVDYDAPSFQDSALWVANTEVPADAVYKMLSIMYTDEGLKHMHGLKKTFKNMSLETGATNIVTPFHPGAVKFWKEKGMLK